MKFHFFTYLFYLWIPLMATAQGWQQLALPNRELLSSDKVNYVMQDSEGFLWYATDGGGVCRDDGRQVDVFRSDAEHPDLLGSNNVICLAEAGNLILIGTTHGANILDKSDYSIRPLKEVGDKRVDDILVTTDGHWWLTANKKLYEYSVEGKLKRILDAGEKYIFRLHEGAQGQLLCTQWEGGTLRFDGEQMVQMTTEWPDSVNFSRITTDCRGRQLVTDGFGECYALSNQNQEYWFEDTILTKETAESVRRSRRLSTRPTSLAISQEGHLWFSTGKDIRCMRDGEEEIVLNNTKDVSAMTFSPDGTLWLGTIFGQLYSYRQGKIEMDEYGSNEYGDGVIAISADIVGRLILVSDRYTRLYDTKRRTLRQQSRESGGTYSIELQETAPGERWSHPHREKVVERIPAWMSSWWMWCIYSISAVCFGLLAIHNYILRRQRRQFLTQIRSTISANDESVSETTATKQPVTPIDDEWIKKAIAQVESHLDDESYTVEQLGSDMCMSRMTLYRKIQTLTGQKPTEFMRTIRLRRAAKLLSEGRMTVTEISYATGFSSVSYFSRCFRTMFGVPPTKYSQSE